MLLYQPYEVAPHLSVPERKFQVQLGHFWDIVIEY